ncbi:P-loop containing nucleoside triphosphate hydrolase protein [Lasiosphaeris hirsuta]|uniref:RNA helicase n=1 Tax=Lasiosphaeris hirsuta TaxID=260670 RepID=A0AA40AH90_9PEZI|nr:P-loop containing nucleoside triphosphate hydrolase protein [Lasiosphaeris hirsuta]
MISLCRIPRKFPESAVRSPHVRYVTTWPSTAKDDAPHIPTPLLEPVRVHKTPSQKRGSEPWQQINPLVLRDAFASDQPKPANKPKPTTGATKRNYELFQALTLGRFQYVLRQMGEWHPGNSAYAAFGIGSQQELDRVAAQFLNTVKKAFTLASLRGQVFRKDNPLFWNLRNAFVKGDARALSEELKYSFQAFAMRSQLSKSATDLHMALADLRHPWEWYPATRMMKRTIHLHVGPTNSGKTYNALKALENAKTGIYAGPLRLLAHEVYTRFKAKGKPCALITGEEQRIPKGVDQYFSSCTVEMSPLNNKVDVAVIDEIQMLDNPDRGWAWTQAFLGMQAKELHLCGEERTVELVQAICARLGEECIVHRYQRLNALHAMDKSLDNKFENLQKGDAVVSFSRINLYRIKRGIEKATGRRCAIVYGSLPPETRAHQAALFNDPDNDYDFLCASDAIGMGLNLEIKRVVFEAGYKFDGSAHRELTVSEVKQIGGRAGRYRTANQDIATAVSLPATGDSVPAAPIPSPGLIVAPGGTSPPVGNKWGSPGFVTALDDADIPIITEAFKQDVIPIKTAGILPPAFVIERAASYFPPHTPLSFILSRLREMAKLSEQFQMCTLTDQIEISDAIQEYPLSIQDRMLFISAPVTLKDSTQAVAIKSMAEAVALMKSGHLLDIKGIDFEILDVEREKGGQDYLLRLESLHKAITLYLWLSYRYDGVFVSQPLAFHAKEIVEQRIADFLEHLDFSAERLRDARERARRLAEKSIRDRGTMAYTEDEEEGLAPDEEDRAPLFDTDAWARDEEAGFAPDSEIQAPIPETDEQSGMA